MKTILIVLGTLFTIGILWLVIWVPLFGFHYETGRGEHTGYITAVERTGIFFKTGTAYVKTNTTSSQEDAYCFIGSDIESQLKDYAASATQVDVYFYSLFSAGITNCAGEGQIIYKIVPIGK